MTTKLRTISLFLLLSVSTCWAGFPTKPITIIVHSKPGSGIDITARQLVNVAAKYTDATILVENKTGGSGTIAMRKVLSKPNDGYFVLAVTKSFISTMLMSNTGLTVDNFDWIAGMVVDPEVLITNKHSKIKTLKDIIADAKKENGKQRWLGPLVGGLDHLMAIKTWQALGISGEWIPYEGGSDALAALLGEHGVIYVGNPVDVKGRPDLMIAAVATQERLPNFPQTPTFKEMGYNLTEEVLWRGFALKRNTAPKAKAFLSDLFYKVSQDPEWIDFINKTSATPVFYTQDKFTETVKTDQQEAKKYLILAGVLSETKSLSAGPSNYFGLGLLLLFIIVMILIWRIKKEWLMGDIIISLVIILGSIYLYSLTMYFPVGKLSGTVGPASMPRLWIYALIFFSVWTIVESIRTIGSKTPFVSKELSKLLRLLGLMTGYLVAVAWLGYYVSTFIFLATGIYLMGYKNVIILLSASGGFVILSYFIIHKILQVPLPTGILFD